MSKSKIIACICEGGAEHAIMDILLKNDVLRFQKKDLLDEKIIRTRSASEFQNVYLKKNFTSKITLYRILDSRRENFNLGKLYKDKVEVINVVTAPEIEMLIIHNENKYGDFKKSSKKPSEYCKENLKMHEVKSYKFTEKYFSDIYILTNAIKTHRRMSKIQKNEITLFDLLK